MSLLRIQLLGGWVLFWGDRPLPPIPGPAARSLLAYLVTYRDRPHTRDLLAGIFWPDLPNTVARRRLSRALWQIRRLLRRQDQVQFSFPVLLTGGGTVQFNPGLPLWLDVEAFERGVQAAGSQQKLDGSCLDRLAASIQLYCGEFMAGYYDDWLLVERERLRELFLDALERLVEGYKGQGEFERALAYVRRLTSEDPWREEAHREMMCLCHLLGRDGEALKQFELVSRILVGELGTEPSPETKALAAEIAAQSGRPRPPLLLPSAARPSRAPLLERSDRIPLVGRRSELAELLHQVEAATEGHGGLTLIYGEAGVGKTRLLQELARNAQWRGLQTGWGRCYELAAPLAYQPLVEALRAGLPTLCKTTIQPLWRAELSRLLPELTHTETSPPPLSPEEERRRLLEAITRGFLALADAGPCLVLLEDAHWMDLASLEALRYLLPRLAGIPLRVVVTARRKEMSGQTAALLTALENTRLPYRLDLGRLNPAETGELIRYALDLTRPVPRFSARLYAETEGNPFFLLEMLRTLVEEGLLDRDADGTWGTPWDEPTMDYAELPLPAGVAQSIERRLDRLPAALREQLGLAAVIGRGVPFALWLLASDRPEEELLAVGEDLCARGLLLPTEPDYSFAHDQIRRVTYDRLSKPRRRSYHRRVAEALTCLSPDELAVLAYHWTQAGVWDRAANCHQQAGDRARAVYANAEAVDHYTQALTALERLPGPADPLRCFELYLARQAVYGLQGERAAQAEDLAALAKLAQAMDDGGPPAAKRRSEVALSQAYFAEVTGDYPQAIASAMAVIAEAQVAAASDLTDRDAAGQTDTLLNEAKGYVLWGRSLWQQGDYAAARTRLEKALTLARMVTLRQAMLPPALQTGRAVEASILDIIGNVYLYEGNYGQAGNYCRQALPVYQEIDDRQGEANVLSSLGVISYNQYDFAGTKDHWEQALHIRRQIGDRRGECNALTNLANVLSIRAEFLQAKAYSQQALSIARDTGDRRGEGNALGQLGEAFAHWGDYAAAIAYFEEALDLFRKIDHRWGESIVLTCLCLYHHYLGDDKAAEACGRQALQYTRELGGVFAQAVVMLYLGHALARQNRLDEAAKLYRQSIALYEGLGTPNWGVEPSAGLARVVLAQGNLSQAQAEVERIWSYLEDNPWETLREPFAVFWACYQVLSAVRDPRAGGVLDGAHRLLQERAARIEDGDLRRTYLENVPAHRALVAAYHERHTPPQNGQPFLGRTVSVRLPRADAAWGRPLRDDEYVDVTWTVEAPQDVTVPGKVARRRQCILRLLAEAQAQGAAPRDYDLAAVLEVSLPTIRRDMAALRSEGHTLPTRRRKMIT